MARLTLDDFKITTSFPVHWGDMDAAQHVNNLVYMKWTETARLLYFEQLGMDLSFKNDEAGPILGWQDCKYTFPVTYPDTVHIGIRTIEVMEDRFVMECGIFSERHKRMAALAKQMIVPYNFKTLKKVDMPETWLEGIRKVEGEDFKTSLD